MAAGREPEVAPAPAQPLRDLAVAPVGMAVVAVVRRETAEVPCPEF